MDKNILKLIKAELKDDIKQRGFKTEDQWYRRLANSQVNQSIFFQGSAFGEQFCVNIYLRPICSCNAFAKHPGHPIRLGGLAYNYDYWWNYSLDSVKDVASLMRKIVFPILDGCTTYRGMFETINPVIDSEFHDSTLNNPAGKVFSHISYVDWIRVLISLNEYEYCKSMINKVIHMFHMNLDTNNKKFEKLKSQTNDTAEIQNYELTMEEIKNDFIKLIDIYKSYLEMVESGNLSEFIKETKENESKSLNTLQKYIVNV